MNICTLPGTTIEADLCSTSVADKLLDPMFFGGGLVLSQVSSLTGLQPHVIQNWVKRGFVSPPKSKKYTKRQFCRIAIINFLKDSLQIDRIVKLISFINPNLSDESDSIIDDSVLYSFFVDVISLISPQGNLDSNKIDGAIERVLKNQNKYKISEKVNISRVIKIMVLIYAAEIRKKQAELLLSDINI